ncbi:SpoIIE family protein phosphatase [Streptomyces sp. ME02-8801-2C]|uniref:SpoIIE family protein phosphatase n=1 Tax=Streptomyces sp. ME02-8801-2C TaxID=3028680 RepID=UPI0029B7DD18|nr:SpoIIE family protein phosphatase [Streptomyces sp. ME02-8801-2C]MDX3456189.1 SpoIIE family protein phosphatase [Streptomyces sp. ME02-8801-2C]
MHPSYDAPRGGGEALVDMTDAVCAVDANGLLTAWSPGARQLLGYAPSDVIGRPAARLLAGDPPVAALRQAAVSRSWRGTVVLRHQNGRRLEADLRAWSALDADGQPQWFLVHSPSPQAEGAYDDPQLSAYGDPRLVEWAFALSPLTLAIYDVDGRILRMNAATRSLLGLAEDDGVIGQVVENLYGEARAQGVPSATAFSEHVTEVMRGVARTGQGIRYEVSAPTSDSREPTWWAVTMSPVTDRTGTVHGVFTAGCDITEQFVARQRLAVLNEASARIGTTLDVTRTADELADVAVPRVADFVSVDLLDSVLRGGEPLPGPVEGTVALRRVAHRSTTAGAPEAVVALGAVDTYPGYSPPARCLVSGRSVLSARGDDDFDRWVGGHPVRAARVRDYGVRAVMAIPVRARGTTLGVAVFVRRRPEPFTSDDLVLAGEMVARAAVCVDNARRYTRERATVLTLQRSLLPRQLPQLEAVEVATRYLPGSSQAGMGGDWFDVIPLSGARVALVVGDVVGHGIHASAAMGRLRIAVRTLADVDQAPDELLTQLDDLVIRLAAEGISTKGYDRAETATPVQAAGGEERAGLEVRGPDEGADRNEMRGLDERAAPYQGAAHEIAKIADIPEAVGEMAATCLYAVYDPISRHCTVARAGGPVPALVRSDGTVDLLDFPAGPTLGIGGLPFEATELEVPEGSLLAFYTDGLIDAQAGNLDELCRVLSGYHARPLESACDTVLERLLPAVPTDDVALLIARTHSFGDDRVATWELDQDPSIVADARKRASDQLAGWGLEDLTFVTELVVSELVTNAIRHGGAPIRLRLILDRSLICEVADGSSAAPHPRRARIFDEGGRGLLLVAQLTDRWGTRQTPTGKIIWAEQSLSET